MSDLAGAVAILTLICIQPALYIFLKSVLASYIVRKITDAPPPKLKIFLGVLGAHLLPFFAVLGKQPAESITNFFSSISYIVPSCSFNACSNRTIDYILFPPDRFVDHVTTAGYWILIFAPLILESIFWLVYFRRYGWQLRLALISMSCLYLAAFLSLYLIDMYAPICTLLLGFVGWIGLQAIRKPKEQEKK